MCGFVCVYDPVARPAPASVLQQMTGTLYHRGPDDFGYATSSPDGIRAWRDEPPPEIDAVGVALGHRRLRILDLSDAGRQPFATASRRFWMVYNGEVYNYVELRTELTRLGHVFRTETDTEVVLAAFQEWGPDSLSRFNGMFAFAIWDEVNKSLFVARDRIGIKPLFYARTRTSWVFASEIKALLQHPEILSELDPERLLRFLRYDETPEGSATFFKGIQALEPATFMRFDKNNVTSVRYWSLPETGFNVPSGADERASFLRELIQDSVKLQLRADVPVGTMLSGGLDSTTIALSINRLLGGDKASSLQKAVSAFYPGAWNDESGKVESLASQLRIEVHRVFPFDADVSQTIEDVIYSVEEPFSGTMPIVQDLMMREAKRSGLTVVLNGHGPDEMLAGYPARHCSFAAAGYLFRRQFRDFASEFSGMRKLHGIPISDFVYTLVRILSPKTAAAVRRRWTTQIDTYLDAGALDTLRSVPTRFLDNQSAGKTPLGRRLRREFDVEIIPRYLHYEDRVSMRSSVESRVPFLDHRIVEYAFSLPDSEKIRNGVTKKILREAMAGRLPSSILDDHRKVYIEAPSRQWLQGCLVDFARDLLGHSDMRIGTLLNIREVNSLTQRVTGRGKCASSEVSLMWRLLTAESWARTYT